MLTNRQADALSKLMTAPDIFPEARKEFSRTLLDYYKELLARVPAQVPMVRRMWQ